MPHLRTRAHTLVACALAVLWGAWLAHVLEPMRYQVAGCALIVAILAWYGRRPRRVTRIRVIGETVRITRRGRG